MFELHEIPEVHILNTVTRFTVAFYGTHRDVHDPKNKIEVRVNLSMTKGVGTKKLSEEWDRIQFEEIDEYDVEYIFDPETKKLTPKNKKVTIPHIANEKQVLKSIDKVVKHALINQKFGNVVNGEY